MSTSEEFSDISLGLFNQSQSESMHLCLIYRDEDERRQVVSKFIKYGFQNNKKMAYYTDIMTIDELKSWFDEMDIDSEKALSEKQLSVFNTVEAYCPHGKFEMERMLATYEHYYQSAKNEGFSGARVTGETNWLVKKIPGTERFIEYEARLNDTLQQFPVATMCQYDARIFDGSMIFDILQVHPFMVVHGQIVKNPAYIKPEQFLKEYRAR